MQKNQPEKNQPQKDEAQKDQTQKNQTQKKQTQKNAIRLPSKPFYDYVALKFLLRYWKR